MYHRRMRRIAIMVWMWAALVIAPSAGRADVDASAPYHMPGVFNHRALGFELMLGTINDAPGDVTLIGFDFDFELPITRRLGLQADLPLVHARGDAFSGTSLGNVTAGLAYVMSGRKGGRPIWSLAGSLSLPTAADGGESGLAATLHSLFRVPQPGLYQPDTTTARFSADVRIDERRLFAQLDMRVEAQFIEGVEDRLLLFWGMGGGARLTNHTSLIAELNTAIYALVDEPVEDFLHSLELGLRHKSGTFTIGARVYVPLDDSLRTGRDAIGIGIDFASAY